MTSSKTDWQALTEALSPQIAASSAQSDLEGSFVRSSYDLLKEHRFFSLAIPSELGGGGASYAELCEVVRLLGRSCPATALAFTMHQHLIAATVWKHRQGKAGEELLRRVCSEQLILLSTGASDWVNSNGRLEAVDGGYLLNARKVFGSGGPACDLLVTSAAFDSPHEGEEVLHFSVPADAPGVRFAQDWDTLGMRGTGSNTIILEGVFVPESAISLRRPAGVWHPAWSVVLTVALGIIMSAYVGVAESAAEKALESARTRPLSAGLTFSAGQLRTHLHCARTLWRDMIQNAREYDFAPSAELANRALMNKTLVTDACMATVQEAMTVAGGRGFFRGFGLERLLRDVQAAPFHPLPKMRQLEFSGLLGLGRDPVSAHLLA